MKKPGTAGIMPIQGGTGPNGQPTARVVSAPANGSNLGTDQRFQLVFQISY